MKTWLNKCIVLFMICMLSFTSCVHGKKVFESTSEQLITEFRNNFDKAVEKYKDSVIVVEGTVSVIEYPKDGFLTL